MRLAKAFFHKTLLAEIDLFQKKAYNSVGISNVGSKHMDHFENLKTFRQDRNRFCNKIGTTVEEIRLGYAKAIKTITEDDLNPIGYPHGGVYFTMADHAAGTAMASHGYQAVTVSANYNFFRAANIGDTLTAEAREIKYGKTISVYDVTVTDQDGILLGSGSFTFYRLEQKIEF